MQRKNKHWDCVGMRWKGETKMLLKAERILTHGDILIDQSEREMFQMVKHELAEKIVSDMIDRGLVKTEIVKEVHDDFGAIFKIRATTRAYNPDE